MKDPPAIQEINDLHTKWQAFGPAVAPIIGDYFLLLGELIVKARTDPTIDMHLICGHDTRHMIDVGLALDIFVTDQILKSKIMGPEKSRRFYNVLKQLGPDPDTIEPSFIRYFLDINRRLNLLQGRPVDSYNWIF